MKPPIVATRLFFIQLSTAPSNLYLILVVKPPSATPRLFFIHLSSSNPSNLYLVLVVKPPSATTRLFFIHLSSSNPSNLYLVLVVKPPSATTRLFFIHLSSIPSNRFRIPRYLRKGSNNNIATKVLILGNTYRKVHTYIYLQECKKCLFTFF